MFDVREPVLIKHCQVHTWMSCFMLYSLTKHYCVGFDLIRTKREKKQVKCDGCLSESLFKIGVHLSLPR